ncbi:acyl-CoA desaturase [Pelagibius sp. Alg239-R121]|uniref:acyl-CoA desaturase n=1 Tax=Pelagibius sp. Alg239-R121 TaxID=2993448 RepID=UPI0024A6C797|nr:acyl-CoA desaturase [Pelagibius sp. Alg239-R121]
MMKPVQRIDGRNASPVEGSIVLDWAKTLWTGGMLSLGLVLAPLYFSWSAFLVFLVLTYLTMLVGHSVGMHRMMIHRTFSCPKWLERSLIYAGLLVGVAGPFGIVKIHDLRDWAQRQSDCHDFFSHRRGFWRDLTWQLFYRFEFEHPPRLIIEPQLAADPWCRFMDRTWRLHQLVMVVPLYTAGGPSWVIWGVCVRVAVSTVGHWTITYFCHNPGPGRWRVKNAAVQASNLPLLGVLSHGECWHNNHHAFPESARIGLDPGQTDPAWQVIRILRRAGLAKDIGQPRPIVERDDLFESTAAP